MVYSTSASSISVYKYDEAYDDAVYGHSVDDHEYGLSPSTEQYLYSQKGSANYGFGAYFPDTEKIKEEEEDFVDEPQILANIQGEIQVVFKDQGPVKFVLDELRNVVGDQFSETELVKSVLEHHYDFESSLNAILNRKSSEATKSMNLIPDQKEKSFNNSTTSKCKPRNVVSVEKKTNIEDENSLLSNSSLDSTKREGAEVNKERGITKVIENTDLADELTDVQISLSNLLPDNLGRTETVTTQFKNIHVTEDSDSFDSSRDTTNLSVSPLSHDVSSSSSSFTFNIPSSSKNKEPVFNFGSPTLSTSPKLNFPSLEGKSKLASLAMNHLNGVGKSHPLGIGKSKGFSPLTNKISSSPVEKQSNLSALASASFGKDL
ncbi:HBS1-like protein [Armadillidium vulgare]|nr:HBS1-like protein [Armadillidium vulgare]